MLPLIVKVQAARLSLQHQLRKLVRSESGATAIEYGLIAAGIAVAIIAAVFALGGEIKAFFEGQALKATTFKIPAKGVVEIKEPIAVAAAPAASGK